MPIFFTLYVFANIQVVDCKIVYYHSRIFCRAYKDLSNGILCYTVDKILLRASDIYYRMRFQAHSSFVIHLHHLNVVKMSPLKNLGIIIMLFNYGQTARKILHNLIQVFSCLSSFRSYAIGLHHILQVTLNILAYSEYNNLLLLTESYT